MTNNKLKNQRGKKGKRKSQKKNFKNGKKKKINGNKKVANSRGTQNIRSEDPLNKGPYGFEHPEAVDVKQNYRFCSA